jgi:hypothetical protein
MTTAKRISCVAKNSGLIFVATAAVAGGDDGDVPTTPSIVLRVMVEVKRTSARLVV